MGFDINNLPPAMQQQALRKLAAQQKPAQLPEFMTKRMNIPQSAEAKYHNVPTESHGITFDSAKEARRYDELLLMLKAGTITDLRLQVNFTLQEGFTTPEGERIKAIIYKADFTYLKSGLLVVEDVKSRATRTEKYLIKKKMLRDRFGIEITEV